MSETLSTPVEQERQYSRLEYGAVPLSTMDQAGERTYADASTERIRDKLQVAIIAAGESGLVKTEIVPALFLLMEAALFNSQMSRINHNPTRNLEAIIPDSEDPRLLRAKNGTATPLDLFSLLEDYPALGSIELAKLSHPFDAEATQDMDVALLDTLLEKGGTLLSESPQYKRKGVDAGIPAGIVLRKDAILNHRTEDGRIIQVVRRQGFVAWSDLDNHPDADLGRNIKNEERFSQLAEKIEGYLEYKGEIPDPTWFQPLATSYYARYLTDEEARKYDQ